MEEWKEYKAMEFCSGVTDGTHDSPKPKTFGHYLITSKHLKDNRIDFSSANQISEEDYQKVILRSAVEQYDILFSMIGTIGNTVQVKQEIVDFAVKNMGIFKMGRNQLKSTWLYYWLNSVYSKQYINQRLAGSTQSYLTLDSLRNFPVSYPGDDIANSIISILKSLDDKIEVNRQINDNLEQQAQALFKSWFVDFEPFRDGEFVESELGMIPKGWRVGTLGEICSQSSLKVGSRNDVKVLSPVTTGNLMLSEEYFTKQVFSESIVKYKVVKKGAFAYNPARVNIGSLGRNEYDFDGAVSPVYVVFECKEGYSNFFDLFRTTERFKTEVLLRSIGGVRQSLNYVDFAMIQTIIAPKDVVDAFNPIMEEIQVMQKHLAEENDRLATLRDTLLPKLMSGELKVFDKPNDQS
ncbi:MAG: restriction endonuclease subunit S [Prevotella sp.]|nr:restriction endonuclease subunit S [Prevotella sp.]